jgi:PAS domain S-box-containing protein
MRAEDEQTLLDDICRVICEEAGYRMVWVGYAERDEAKTIRPVAWAGVETEYLGQAGLTWADTQAGSAPSGVAIRTGASVCIQDFTSDPQGVAWRVSALMRGYGSRITLPLEDESAETFGILTIYSVTPNAFTRDEVRLLTELAADLAFGIRVLRARIERKEIEAEQEILSQRLRDHQFYTRSLFEANIDALMTTDPSGSITDVNRQMEALTGCTRDELIGAPFKSYFTDPERAQASIKLVLSHKKLTNYELTARARDGAETVVSFNATTFYDRDRRLQGVFAAARDITERRALDQALHEKNLELEGARSVAEKANLAKSDFLSSMSHELRSPLNAILGFAQLMESDTDPPRHGHKDNVAQILQAGWHLLKLINEILDLAKVESGQVRMSEEPVSLAEVMVECHGMVEPQAQQRRIRMLLPRFEQPFFVLADRTRVKQVLVNLLSNAIKYNTDEGSVEVLVAETARGRTRVSFRDTGAGLSPEQLTQLFQAFNRLGQEGGSAEGTGIGLVVAKRLVELMGGEIGVESEVGQGSVFWFELATVAQPRLIDDGGHAATLTPAPALRQAQPRTLLYVEDNPANLKLVQQIIARYSGTHLLGAVTGRAGIAMARASLPDVILMDINLPDIDGYEALRVLRADAATAHIPAIAISANAMPPDIDRGLRAGFFRYLTKPIRVNQFMEALEEALAHAQDGAGQVVQRGEST